MRINNGKQFLLFNEDEHFIIKNVFLGTAQERNILRRIGIPEQYIERLFVSKNQFKRAAKGLLPGGAHNDSI